MPHFPLPESQPQPPGDIEAPAPWPRMRNELAATPSEKPDVTATVA